MNAVIMTVIVALMGTTRKVAARGSRLAASQKRNTLPARLNGPAPSMKNGRFSEKKTGKR
jgi:hypothetical protein